MKLKKRLLLLTFIISHVAHAEKVLCICKMPFLKIIQQRFENTICQVNYL